MTDIIQPISAAGIGTVVLRPLPDVQPFSIQSGYSFEGILSDMRTWLIYDLVPYLQDNSAAAIFQSNVDTMIDTVNKALTDQSGIVTAALNTAVNEVINGDIPIADPLILAVLNAVSSQTRDWLDGRYGISAPPPSGEDDTAILQSLLARAQTVGGTLYLQSGAYQANLVTAQSFVQPKIVGKGKAYTSLAPYDPTKAALRFQGGSGGNSGGYVSDLSLVGNGIAGLHLADVCDVHWDRLHFANGFTVGAILFDVTQDQGFCEFNHGEATFAVDATLALRYRTSKNSETSFHGSGLTGGKIDYNGPYAVQIDPNCFPYNAPLTLTAFSHTANTQLIRNMNVNREVSFFGTLCVEHQADGYLILGANGDGHGRVIYVGEFSGLNGPVYFGQLYFADALLYIGGNTFKKLKPWSKTVTLSNGTVPIPLMMNQGEHAMLLVEIEAPGWSSYHYISAFQSPGNPTVRLAMIAQEVYVRNNGQSDPTFTGENGALNIADVSFNSGYTAKITVNTDHNGFNVPMSQS